MLQVGQPERCEHFARPGAAFAGDTAARMRSIAVDIDSAFDQRSHVDRLAVFVGARARQVAARWLRPSQRSCRLGGNRQLEATLRDRAFLRPGGKTSAE